MSNVYKSNGIISIKSISIDDPTTYSSVLFTKEYVYVVPRMTLSDNKPITQNGKSGYDLLVELLNSESDITQLQHKAHEITLNFNGHLIDIRQLKNLSVKNGLLSRGIYFRENIDTFKKFNRAVSGGGKELYTHLAEFYKDFKPMSW
jgi:hypothetical protein